MKRMLIVMAMALARPALAQEPPLCGTSGASDWARIQEVFTGD